MTTWPSPNLTAWISKLLGVSSSPVTQTRVTPSVGAVPSDWYGGEMGAPGNAVWPDGVGEAAGVGMVAGEPPSSGSARPPSTRIRSPVNSPSTTAAARSSAACFNRRGRRFPTVTLVTGSPALSGAPSSSAPSGRRALSPGAAGRRLILTSCETRAAIAARSSGRTACGSRAFRTASARAHSSRSSGSATSSRSGASPASRRSMKRSSCSARSRSFMVVPLHAAGFAAWPAPGTATPGRRRESGSSGRPPRRSSGPRGV
ncbi:hypothetical protein HRbin26_02036 [bacterium HR26]|nr:hypothetical protein HRbin26_02036 [bacterium HR26]